MGSRNNPGVHDCYSKAEPDEPMFVLLGRDPFAAMLVSLWAKAASEVGKDPEKCAEAQACAEQMIKYVKQRSTQEELDRYAWAMSEVAGQMVLAIRRS